MLVVTVPGGQRPRTVVMRDAYTDLLREVIDLHNSAKHGKKTRSLATRRHERTSDQPSRTRLSPQPARAWTSPPPACARPGCSPASACPFH